ncbi:hypothetical protein RS030_2308 [Cryptosporidium xiaoi]|uniref:tRNA-dihydrouridine(47) synthase [NAD(P)(+)] n=1 Tax=Cryptosporidium xiaoi TaxID=659607 RepID=A0AAV9XVG6_9CRYT
MEKFEMDEDSYIKSCLTNSEAPIKREFLDFSYEKERNEVKLDNNNNCEKLLGTENNMNTESESRKRSRGMFKSSERNMNTGYISWYGMNGHICNNIATIGECNLDSGLNCNKNHDLSGYIEMKKKEMDHKILTNEYENVYVKNYLNKKCPIFEKYGVCYLGLNCEFALNSHFDESNMLNINSNGEKVTSEMLNDFYRKFELNRTGIKIKSNVRKKLIEYPKTEEFFNISTSKSASSLINSGEKRSVNKKNKSQKKLINPLLPSLNTENEKAKEQESDILDDVNLKIEKSFLDKHSHIHCTEKMKISANKNKMFNNKLILAPLTTVGNLPFRRLCTKYGADITVSEMVLCNEILAGKPSELALLKRSPDEKCFGIQLACGNKNTLIKTGEFISNNYEFDFIDINAACPVKSLHEKGGGSVLIDREEELELMIKGLKYVIPKDKLVTVKLRMSHSGSPINKSLYKDNFTEECENWSLIYKHMKAHKIMGILCDSGVDGITIHGRTSFQRYTKEADWDYIKYCSLLCSKQYYKHNSNYFNATVGVCPSIIGCGDVLTYNDYQRHIQNDLVDSVMIGRGALLKPWIFTEIKENRNWDISSNERLDILKQFVDFGLEHWGSDKRGVALTRRFLLEFLSFYHRYIPIGILEQSINSQSFNWRIPKYIGRNDLETLLSSQKVEDWIKISEMLLGKVPSEFVFIPKHKANSY